MARKPAPRRGASKAAASRRTVPGWVWLFTGVVSGLFIAFLFHLGQRQMADQPPPRAAASETAAPAAESAGADSKDGKEPRFDFYAVLPQMEVIVPKGDDAPAQQSRPNQASDSRTTSSSAPARARQHFLLQAGSFRRGQDADRRRAELILQGFDARVQPVNLESGDTWHRVMIGPFDNSNAMHRAQDKLATAGIETLPIQVKDPG